MVFQQYSISRLQPSVFWTGVPSCSMVPRVWYTCCLPRNLMALLMRGAPRYLGYTCGIEERSRSFKGTLQAQPAPAGCASRPGKVGLRPGDSGNDRSQAIHEPRRDDKIGHVTLLPPGVQLLDDAIHAAHERCGRLQHVLRSKLQACGELRECGLPMSGHLDV